MAQGPPDIYTYIYTSIYISGGPRAMSRSEFVLIIYLWFFLGSLGPVLKSLVSPGDHLGTLQNKIKKRSLGNQLDDVHGPPT